MRSRNDFQGMIFPTFEDDLAKRTSEQIAQGVLEWINGATLDTLPSHNDGYELEFHYQLTRMLGSMRDYMLKIARMQVANLVRSLYYITYSMMDAETHTTLYFSAVPGLTTLPTREIDYEIFKNGMLMTNTVSMALLPGIGVQFADAWTAGDVGDLRLSNLGFGLQRQIRHYYGRSLTGTGHTVANLASIGADITGAIISPLPTSQSQIAVFCPGMLTPTLSWTFALDPVTGNPIVTLVNGIREDQIIHFEIVPPEVGS